LNIKILSFFQSFLLTKKLFLFFAVSGIDYIEEATFFLKVFLNLLEVKLLRLI